MTDQIYRLLATTAKHWNVAPPGAFSLEYDMEQPPYLTDAEIAKMCEPLINGAARYRFITKLGLHAKRKPNGQPLVARSEFERVMGAARMAQATEVGGSAGDMAALRERWRGRNGAQAQRR